VAFENTGEHKLVFIISAVFSGLEHEAFPDLCLTAYVRFLGQAPHFNVIESKYVHLVEHLREVVVVVLVEVPLAFFPLPKVSTEEQLSREITTVLEGPAEARTPTTTTTTTTTTTLCDDGPAEAIGLIFPKLSPGAKVDSCECATARFLKTTISGSVSLINLVFPH
jgi:hypothetical protein